MSRHGGNLGRAVLALALALVSASTLQAQTRVVLPEGTVIVVRTESILDSSTARVGNTFETTVADAVGVDGFQVIPAGSTIQGTVAAVQSADRQRSGVMAVEFDRLVLPDGTSYPIDGRLTSTNPAERRQIEADPDARVVLVGGRGGMGAAIAGAGSQNDPISGILGALGAMLSEGRDVRVPAGTQLAVQLQQGLTLRVRGQARPTGADAFTIFTSTDLIRAAQQELARRDYYRGTVNGRLDEATQRALFEFQIDQRILATGNLDGRTAEALGLSAAGPSAALTPQEAALLRRSSQALVGRYRTELGIATTGRLSSRRSYTAAELELWFALSAFADNTSLYEQVVGSPTNVEGTAVAGEALIAAAERVDTALNAARPSARVAGAWETIRNTLADVDPDYAGG
jgi:peptidoglycan hydrolase-like protein with peptidoglycan-binding domain